MDIILAFVLTTNAGITIDYAPEYRFTSQQQCAKFAVNESRDLIVKRYKGKGIHKVIPACRKYTRSVALQIAASKGI